MPAKRPSPVCKRSVLTACVVEKVDGRAPVRISRLFASVTQRGRSGLGFVCFRPGVRVCKVTRRAVAEKTAVGDFVRLGLAEEAELSASSKEVSRV